MKELVKKAMQFAINAHGKQKYGNLPYKFHCHNVYETLRLAGVMDDNILAASWLHDVIEDTDNTEASLELEFNYSIAHTVQVVSNTENIEETFIKISLLYSACLVKIADRIANLSMCIFSDNYKMLQKYLNQHELFNRYIVNSVYNVVLKNVYLELIELGYSTLLNK
jgi:(p)ppGpp synthase/HD superfamily hydrolase